MSAYKSEGQITLIQHQLLILQNISPDRRNIFTYQKDMLIIHS